jgi:hypothetical protein
MHSIAAVILLASAVTAAAATTPYSSATWMGALAPFTDARTVLDLAWPGTHDTMTYDLSATVADGANDLPAAIADILHNYGNLSGIGDFVRMQATTQPLNITQQLDAGIRFVDFRVMWSAAPTAPTAAPHAWYNLHVVQSIHTAASHLRAIRAWLDAHPTEMIVLWVSRHGAPCGNEYPDVPAAVQRSLLQNITAILGAGMLADWSGGGAMNTTTLGALKAKGQRVVLMLSSYANVTGGGSPLAVDACDALDNETNEGDSQDPPAMHRWLLGHFAAAAAHRRRDAKRRNRMFLMSLARGGSGAQITDAFLLHYFPALNASVAPRCAALFGIPGMTAWCPPTLASIGQLTNYFSQQALEAAVRHPEQYDLPGAIYIDAADADGTVRTGTNTTAGLGVDTQRYAYVATFALSNLWRAVAGGAGGCKQQPACAALEAVLQEHRAAYPLAQWADPEHGRVKNWF